MKPSLINLKQLLLMVLLALSQSACDNAVFSSQSANGKVGIDPGPLSDPQELVFIDDSFERDDLFIDIANQIIYGWRGFILDGNQSVLGFTDPDGATIRIPPANEFGPAADGDRAMYMYGDPDSEIEVLHVISRSYDLSQYNTALIAFKYLTFGLNDGDDAAPEHLKLQVCRGTLNDCGANDDFIFPDGQLSNNWVTVFDSSDNLNFNDDALNGKNHVVSDWQSAVAAIDLNNPEFVGDSSTFVFRFVATMEEGLATGQCQEKCTTVCKDHKDTKRHTASVSAQTSSKHKHDHKCKDKSHKKDKDGKCKHKDCKHKDCKDKKCNDKKCKDKKCKDKKCKDKKCKHCEKKCETVCQPGDGSLRDGVAVDQVFGRATTLLIDEIF